MGDLMDAGMDVARLNFSHGTHESHREVFERLRRLAKERNRHLAVLQDLSGPKIRLGEVVPDSVLHKGDEFVLTSESLVGDSRQAQCTYPQLAHEVDPGDSVLLDDGLLELRVERVEPPRVVTRVVVGGPLSSHKGVNLPGSRLSIPALTEKDEADLRFGLELGVDYVALSFVRKPTDAELVRAVMRDVGIHRPVIAKIEKPEAVQAMDEILDAFDGVMVARGDLGIEMPMEYIPVAQKRIIKECVEREKPVITATQMLDSMIRNPRPTRAEVTDIANAILDGTDALMLSGETASGAWPVEAVKVMDRVAREAEACLPYEAIHAKGAPSGEGQEAVALGACEIAEVVGAKAIIVSTWTGHAARRVSQYRPRAPILAVAHDEAVARQLSLLWGVIPWVVDPVQTSDELFALAVQAVQQAGLAGPGDCVVFIAGVPPGRPTNLVYVTSLEG